MAGATGCCRQGSRRRTTDEQIPANEKCVRRNACIQSGATPPEDDSSFATVEQAVAALVPHLNELERIAQRRLRRLARQEPGQRLLARADPLDYVMGALHLVLAGSQDSHSGRQTQLRHLRSLRAFRYHVQDVLSSHISHELERMRRQGEHLPIGPETPDSPCVDPLAAVDVVREVSLRETRRELWVRLSPHAKGQAELMAALEIWSERWLAEHRISQGELKSRDIHELRVRARKALGEMARRDDASDITGREILGP